MPETVTILSVHDVTLPVAPGVFKVQHAVTYAAKGIPFRTVYLDADKDTDQERARAIAEDLKAARAAKAQTLDIP